MTREDEIWEELEKAANKYDALYKAETKALRDELSAIQATKPSPSVIILQGGDMNDVLRSALGIGPCDDPECESCNPSGKVH